MAKHTQESGDVALVLSYILNNHVTTADLGKMLEHQERWEHAFGIDSERLKRALGYLEGLRAEGHTISYIIDT